MKKTLMLGIAGPAIAATAACGGGGNGHSAAFNTGNLVEFGWNRG
jgi:hypothetical protein